MSEQPIPRTAIDAAARRLEGPLRTTPIMTVDGSQLGTTPGSFITMKLEYLQYSGTFKARGAMNFMLANEISSTGVTAASGGNHGAAVAWAARELGHAATIFVPTISSPAKVSRLKSYGAEVIQVGAVYAESLQACRDHETTTGATGIHAYEAPDVVAGAGTTGREFEAQVQAAGLEALDAVLVACGGGGLVGGIASWFGAGCTAIACETDTTNAFAAALAAGSPVDISVSGVAADALGASRIGSLAFDALTAANAKAVTVPDQAVIEARQLLWETFRIVVEPSAAVPVAVLTSGAWSPDPGQHIGVVVCGAIPFSPISAISFSVGPPLSRRRVPLVAGGALWSGNDQRHQFLWHLWPRRRRTATRR